MNETLQIDDLAFEIRRSSRRKTLSITVDRAGELVVHVPEATAEAELWRWVKSKLMWVHSKLLIKEELAGTLNRLDFVSGESMSYLGQNYRLKIVEKQKEPLRFDDGWFLLRERDRVKAEEHFRQWYIDQGTPWLEKRVKSWERKAGAMPSRIVVDDLGFRWGSCGKHEVLYFNWRLLQLPVRLVDYVVVHELVHLVERNHSPRFWQALERAIPDWKVRERQLESDWSRYLVLRTADAAKNGGSKTK